MKIYVLVLLIFNCGFCANATAVDSIFIKNKNPKTESQKIEMVVFNAETFFVVENTLSINKECVKVIDNKISSSKVIIVHQKSEINKNILIASHKLTPKSKSLTASTTVSENTSESSKYLPYKSIPYNEYLFSCKTLYCASATSKLRLIKLSDFCCTKIYVPFLQKEYKAKNLFQINETIITSKNYLKTSRIRPPPVA